jgi:hypothetical protein
MSTSSLFDRKLCAPFETHGGDIAYRLRGVGGGAAFHGWRWPGRRRPRRLALWGSAAD